MYTDKEPGYKTLILMYTGREPGYKKKTTHKVVNKTDLVPRGDNLNTIVFCVLLKFPFSIGP